MGISTAKMTFPRHTSFFFGKWGKHWLVRSRTIGDIILIYYIYNIHVYIWVNYNDLTAPTLESWLIRDIIPKWPALIQVIYIYWNMIIYPDARYIYNYIYIYYTYICIYKDWCFSGATAGNIWRISWGIPIFGLMIVQPRLMTNQGIPLINHY